MRNFQAIFSFLDFLPLISINLAYLDSLDHSLGNASNMHDHFVGDQRDDSSEGVAESLVQSAELFNEIESTVLHGADLVHEVFVVVGSEAETVDAENAQLRILLPGQCLPERLLCALVLTVREEENRSDLIGDLSIPDGLEGQVHAAHDVGASRGEQVVDVC